MKKKNSISHYFFPIIILGSALVVVLLLTFVFSKSNIEFAPGINISNHTAISNSNASLSSHSGNYYMKADVTINGFNLVVDVPITSDQFQKGLDIKDHLNENQGMLFIFKEPDKVPFWMHGMKFPIDIIWFDKDKNVIHIEHNLQPCITDPYNLLSRFITISCPSYSPEKDALYV